MTFLTAFLAKIPWAAIGGLLVGLGGILFGMFRHEQAKTATATAAQKVAEKEAEVAKSNEAAHKAATDAVETAATVKSEVEKLPDSVLDQEGRNMGILRD